MQSIFPPPSAGTTSQIVLDAARCWRTARDAGDPVQPSLFAALRAHGCDILAPVFDSLMTLCELALGRPLQTGEQARLSDDEHLLLALLSGKTRPSACFACGKDIAGTLDCALCSTRIMMALAGGCPRGAALN